MVKGLGVFRDHFRDLTDQFVLIGGAACDIAMEVEESHLTPIPTDEQMSSLSAILLEDAYYEFLHSGRRVLDGVPFVGLEHLDILSFTFSCGIPFPASSSSSPAST